jgi:hypothetical protein
MPKQTEEHIRIWNEYIQKYGTKLKRYVPKIYENTDYSAVIVEPREHKDLETVIKTVMYFLNESDSKIKWGLTIIHGESNKKFVKKIVDKWEGVELQNLWVNNLTPIQYNRMLMGSQFWKQLKTENILLFQTDSTLVKFGIDQFISYIYIGAPWIKFREGKIVGNGGLSFRKKSKMIEISETYVNDEITMEDIYFCKYLKEEDLPDIGIAKQFSVEDVEYDDPLGLHQPKINPILLENILKKGLKRISYGK